MRDYLRQWKRDSEMKIWLKMELTKGDTLAHPSRYPFVMNSMYSLGKAVPIYFSFSYAGLQAPDRGFTGWDLKKCQQACRENHATWLGASQWMDRLPSHGAQDPQPPPSSREGDASSHPAYCCLHFPGMSLKDSAITLDSAGASRPSLCSCIERGGTLLASEAGAAAAHKRC